MQKQNELIKELNDNIQTKQLTIDTQATELANKEAKIFLLNEKIKKEVELAKTSNCGILTKGKYLTVGIIIGIIIKTIFSHTSGGNPY